MEWFHRWFGEDYLLVYGHRDDAEAERDVRFIERVLKPADGAFVLDLCCGTGRHSRALAQRGYRTIGLDASAPLLAEAREAESSGLDRPLFIRGDSRLLPFRGAVFDIVLNLFTSFGYFTHCENCIMLGEIARVLKPGGFFFIDLINPSRVAADLVPETVRECGGAVIVERRSIDVDARRVEKTITIRSCGEEREFRESVSLYTLPEMETMLGDAGLSLDGTAGSMEGAVYNDQAERMIMWGRKG